MSPLTNVRTDAYGGSFENRLRFPLEILAAVREAAGPDAIVGIRLSVEEGVPGGLGIPEMQEIARALTKGGLVSYISASYGTYANMEIQVAPMPTPPGHLAYLAAGVKRAVDVPVLAVGRILDPDLAERIVASGEADLIGMARELIADPDFVAKTFRGTASDIRRCVGCNYCQSRLWFGTSISCIHNPAAGRERELGRDAIRPAAAPRRVLVVGGGPAGLEAARMAASRGHHVTLAERTDELGGQLLLSRPIASRAELLGVLDHLTREVERERVEVQLRRELTAADVLAAAPDAVVLATGSTAHARGYTAERADRPSIQGLASTVALSGREALSDPDRLRDPVLLVDIEGHVSGLAIAEFLLDRGRQVTFATSQPFPGSTIGAMAWVKLLQAVTAKGATFRAPYTLVEVEGESAKLQNIFGGAPETVFAGSVVVVGESTADDALQNALDTAGFVGTVLAVGDCVAPRHLDMAILEGARAGLAL